MKIVIIVLIWLVALLLTFIVAKGKGRPITLLDQNGNPYPNGISTREKIMVGGKEQYIFLAGEDKNNPILLFLHGGPGSPEVAMHSFEPGQRLEERFTVCYWEQRGAGLSYGARLEPDQMNLELMVNDTIELTEYLRERFDQKQIYIMGHSWGTFLGAKTIQQKPEYFKAYFGVAQVTNQIESEKLAYEYLLSHAIEIQDQQAVKDLEKIDPAAADFPSNTYLMSSRTKYMNKYGVGIKHIANYNMSEFLKQVLFFEGYSAFDFLKFGLGNLFCNNTMSYIVNSENLMETTNQFQVPVYIFHGIHDQQVSYRLSLQYYEGLSAPDKGFYTFENSAHSPNFEEPEKFLSIVFSLLDEK